MPRYRLRKTSSLFVGLLLTTWLPTRALALEEEEVDRLKQEAMDAAETIRPLINELSRQLWEYAEVGLQETRSAALLSEKLEASGFAVERGVAELPTAFVATFGSGSPVVGILAEYDALPGVGNEPVPEKRARSDGVRSGHGCGHNLFGAGSVGGAIALKDVLTKNNLSGTIKLFGTPAEEPDIGKLYMAKAGVFEGLDAVLEWHPSTENAVGNGPGLALNNFEIEFFGQTAHASADPWNGRSALDAVEMMMNGINLLREHMVPTARLHYVITHGGEAPNVVPDYTKMWLNVREATRAGVNELYDRVLKIAEAAARATGTTP